VLGVGQTLKLIAVDAAGRNPAATLAERTAAG